MAPENASPWVYSREALWNRVEAYEKRKDAQLAREVELALPHELSHDQRLGLVRQYVQEQFVNRGMVADIAIHEGHSDDRNIHAHIMLTMRELGAEGFGRKVTQWNDPRNVKHWRREWARQQNRAYREAGIQQSVDHRSYEERGIDKTPQIHEGPKARRMQERGYEPRSKTVQRASWTGKKRTLNYRKLDKGRTRRQRNQQIAWRNRLKDHPGLSRLVPAHIHRMHFENTWQQAREAGQGLRTARKNARRAEWRRDRARDVFRLHRQRLTDLLRVTVGNSALRDRLNDFMLYRCAKLAQARKRLARDLREHRRVQREVRNLQQQYHNLKSRLGDEQRKRVRNRLERDHIAALQAVSVRDLREGPLNTEQVRRLVRDRERLRYRERDREPEHDITDLFDRDD